MSNIYIALAVSMHIRKCKSTRGISGRLGTTSRRDQKACDSATHGSSRSYYTQNHQS